MDKKDIIGACPLLADFTEVGVRILSTIAREKHVKAGTPIFVQGMVGDTLFIVGSGEVRIAVKGEDGTETTIGSMGPYEAFGQVALLGGSTRMASTYAETDCDLIEIHLKDFGALQKKKPQACIKLMMSIAKNLGHRLSEDGDTWRKLLADSMT